MGYGPWSRKELDMTERLTLPLFSCIYLCSFFKRSFSRIVYYKIFNIVLCALQ